MPAVYPDEREPREKLLRSLEYELRPVSVLNVRFVDFNFQNEAKRVNQDVPLPAFDFLACVISAKPLFSVVFTDWESRIAADGSESFPFFFLTCLRSSSWTFRHVPSFVQSSKYLYTTSQRAPKPLNLNADSFALRAPFGAVFISFLFSMLHRA
jgi:hypothetical protein